MTSPGHLPRFVTLEHVQTELSISYIQTLALVRSGQLRAIKVGGRGVWRVSLDAFEDYIAERYAETSAMARAESSGTAESLRSRWSRKWSPPRADRLGALRLLH